MFFINRIKYWLPSVIWAGLIFFLSCQQGSDLPSGGVFAIKGIDKVFHFTEYVVLTILLIFAFEKDCRKMPDKTRFKIIFCIVFLYGLSDEMHQIPVSDRYFDLMDLFSDGMGALLTLFIFYVLNLKLFFTRKNAQLDN